MLRTENKFRKYDALPTSKLTSGTWALMARIPVMKTSSSQRKSEDLVALLVEMSLLTAGTVSM